ncbi:Methyltransferase type 12 [Kribbella flavida DSM 17836]|uniref:Methyltransferase type 12 n=1 Tax=Kribbella flavida (strain DSM 17836 / JCM 10339 / NBRC 14399) TaxID=479435 RepID=D2PS64_KRIFD|nr:class I SAM-dependent methyltransferase [Kribbella flavida]ADB31188.1 Methyltransferase type 12 [Kribbella flavida DSM 17836]
MTEINWADQAEHLRSSATDDAGWNEIVAAGLVRPTDRVLVDVGCGGGGMAKALAAALPAATVVALDADEQVLRQAREHTGGAVRCELVSMDDGPEPLRQAIGTPADLVWASASVHHAADQQSAIDALASLLAPGGRLALAEGGLPARSLPWDLGIGEPGLELRLDLAQDRWFAGMRAVLPGSVPMPYGWTDALRRAGLTGVTTRTILTEKPVPLSDEDRTKLIEQFRHRIDRLDPTATAENSGHGHGHGHGHGPAQEEWLSPDDLAVWRQLLDPAGPHHLGRRTDLAAISARSIHVGHLPA